MKRETGEYSFDELAKGLATGTVSRGKALRMFGAALVGGTLASIPGLAWAARPVCPSGVRCRGQCCPEGATCVQGAGGGCTCPAGQIACDNACVPSDNNNCGACGNVCTGGQVCENGSCVCPEGLTDCNGTCVDTTTDPFNCGACGNQCGTNSQGPCCVQGGCIGFASADPSAGDLCICAGGGDGCQPLVNMGFNVTCCTDNTCREICPA
jgi:hypothetical protein